MVSEVGCCANLLVRKFIPIPGFFPGVFIGILETGALDSGLKGLNPPFSVIAASCTAPVILDLLDFEKTNFHSE